jgi:hypothetical protein
MFSRSNLIAALFICAIAPIASAPLQLPLSAGSQPTLASIFGSTQNGKTSFHIPNTPHFRYWYDFTAPRNYSAFYTTDAGKISLAGLLRFVEEGLTLFANNSAQQECQKALNNALLIHKDFQARPSKKKRAALEEAQTRVLETFAKIELTEETAQNLCALLSSPEESTLKKILLKFVLPYRSHIVATENPTESIISRGDLWKEIVKYWFGGITLGLALSLPLAPVITVATPIIAAFIFDRSFPAGTTFNADKTIVTGFEKGTFKPLTQTISLSSAMDRAEGKALFIKHWGPELMTEIVGNIITCLNIAVRFTNIKLAPEPEDGVMVTLGSLDQPQANTLITEKVLDDRIEVQRMSLTSLTPSN